MFYIAFFSPIDYMSMNPVFRGLVQDDTLVTMDLCSARVFPEMDDVQAFISKWETFSNHEIWYQCMSVDEATMHVVIAT